MARAVSPGQFKTFGELLKYLRKREELTQRDLAIAVGYSDTQISRIEQNSRLPDAATIQALFVPALHLENDPEWVVRLLELASQGRQETDLPSASRPLNNLPVSLTSFIGRESEQAEIRTLLDRNRLVTLLGAGGIGKTRMSREVGSQVLPEFAHGVWLVELAPLGAPELLPQTVASALGITSQSSIPEVELLVTFLHQKKALLILDNCEHLLDACVQLASRLLQSCPDLKILATSREALGILGEVQYRVPSLELPDSVHDLDRLRQYGAVRLFEARARLVQSNFSISQENAASIVQICSRLDGIPLAIELAAARLDLLSPEQLAQRLDRSFSLLTGGDRSGLPRQQTLRASIDWSWDLTSEEERTLLSRLSVFAGGWTLESAEMVCGTAGLDPSQILDLMGRLVAKSLVNADPGFRGQGRYSCHETIRQYSAERLVESGELENLRARHLDYFLRLAGRTQSEMRGPDQMEWLRLLDDERGNLRLAMDYSLRTELQKGLELCGRLGEYWEYLDLREGLKWTTAFLTRPESHQFPRQRAWALTSHANVLWYLQQFDAAREHAEEALGLFLRLGEWTGEFHCLMILGGVLQLTEGMQKKTEYNRKAFDLARSHGDKWREAFALGALGWDRRDYHQSFQYWEDSVRIFRELGDWRALNYSLSIMGFTALSNGDTKSAEKYLDEAAEVNSILNDRMGLEFILTGRSQMALMRKDYRKARALMQEWIAMAEELGNRMGYLWGRGRLANIALREGNTLEARQLLLETLTEFHRDLNKNGLSFSLDKMAALLVLDGLHDAAARLIGWSDFTRMETGDPRPVLEQKELDQEIRKIKKQCGAAVYEAAYSRGAGLTLDEAVLLALQVGNPS